jgi:hypothetical protein
MTHSKNLPLLFIIRRAIRASAVTRGDILRAFPNEFSETKASELLNKAVKKWSKSIVRKGNKVVPHPKPFIPEEASEEDLIDHLDKYLSDFRYTGLTAEELPVIYVKWRTHLPFKTGALNEITAALKSKTSLHIQYIGLKKGDTGAWKHIFPYALERLDDQWRLIAFDLKEPDFPVRVYPLSRIRDSCWKNEKPPRKFKPSYTLNSYCSVKVTLNKEYTKEQKEVLSHELKVKEGEVEISKRSRFEYFRKFGKQEINENSIWPPFIES